MVGAKVSVVTTWLNSDPTLQKFNMLVQRKRLALTTRETYVKNVKCLVNFMKLEDPQQLLDHIKSLTVEQRTTVIDDLVAHLLDRGVHTTTVIQLVRGGLKKWFTLNQVEIDWNKIQAEILPGEEILVEDRMPTKKELKELMNVGSLRDRVLILVATSSGLRVGTLATLTLGDISLEEPVPRVVVKRRPGRKISRRMKGFATFITPEAKTVLMQYIQHRESLGEQLTGTSPILTSDRKEELGNFLNSGYVSNHWRRLLKRAHLATKNGGPWNDIHLHTLRKYFETQCTNAGIKTTYREFWLGHLGGHLEESYFRGEVETHIQEYKKAIPYLSVTEAQPEDYKALVEKIRFLEQNGKHKQQQIEQLHTQQLENQELKTRIQKTEEKLGKMEKLIQEVLERL